MENFKFNVEELKDLFINIGLANPSGENYKKRSDKYKQVIEYIVQLRRALNKLSTKRTIVLLDCGCGRSYLSFIFSYFLKINMPDRKVQFYGIDYNQSVIDRCKEAAESLGLTNMKFYHGDVLTTKLPQLADIVYSLHACDKATDQTITRGIMEQAKFILSASCCQHTVRKQIKKHELTSITKYKPYKERVADMLSDTMRALILEAYNYNVDVFEFVSSRYTPKNVMVRAMKGSAVGPRQIQAIKEYNKLRGYFNLTPTIEEYLGESLMIKLDNLQNQAEDLNVNKCDSQAG